MDSALLPARGNPTLFLVGCVNLSNLLLARAAGRQKEFAIRGALGATRMKLVRQCFFETLPVALAGTAFGILAADWLLALLIPVLPPGLPRVEEITIQTPVLLFTIFLSVAAALAISVVPAMQVSASIQRGPSAGGRLHDMLIATEIAGTIVLLIGAGLLIRSFINVRGTDPGFDPERVLSLHLAVDRARHGGDDRSVARFLGSLIEQVQSVPGVQSAAIVNRLPLSGQQQTLQVEFEDRGATVNIDSRSISADYFRTLGVPILSGRSFRVSDTGASTAVGIIDQQVARQVFGRENPLGRRFRIPIVPGMPWVQIVGVAGHIRSEDLETDPRPQVYWPYGQRTQDRMAMIVKTAGASAQMAAAVRSAIRQVDPDQPLYDERPMAEVVQRTLIGRRLSVVLVSSFAALALLLASAGLYAVVAHLAARRSREFGIRLAVGANPGQLLRMVLKQALGRAAWGLTAGLVLSAAVTRLLSSIINGVGTLDPLTYAAVAALFLVVVLAASYLPARRASKTDPMIAMRSE